VTAAQIALAIGGVWLVGSGVGAGLFLLLARRIYGRGVAAGSRQSELEHGWHRPLFGGVNAGYAATDRHRSPDDQLVTRSQFRSPAQPHAYDL
jgi:hypothetical protein